VPLYPTAELTVPRGSLKIPGGAGDAGGGDVAGTLKLHGRTRAVTFHYDAKRDSAIHVSGAVHVNMTDFGIDAPSYLGVSVKPDVDVTVRFDVNEG
jgi:polyisoprenoid-binding protein YceI